MNAAAVIAFAMLLVYAWRTTSTYIDKGQTAPPDELPAPEIIAAAVVDWAKRYGRPIDPSLVNEVVEQFQSGYPVPAFYPGVSF